MEKSFSALSRVCLNLVFTEVRSARRALHLVGIWSPLGVCPLSMKAEIKFRCD